MCVREKESETFLSSALSFRVCFVLNESYSSGWLCLIGLVIFFRDASQHTGHRGQGVQVQWIHDASFRLYRHFSTNGSKQPSSSSLDSNLGNGWVKCCSFGIWNHANQPNLDPFGFIVTLFIATSHVLIPHQNLCVRQYTLKPAAHESSD